MKYLFSILFAIVTCMLFGQGLQLHRADTIWLRVDQHEKAWLSLNSQPGEQAIPFNQVFHKVRPNAGTGQSSMICYKVRPKDNLFRISRIYTGYREEELMALNRLKSSNLDIGQVLTIGFLETMPKQDQSFKDLGDIMEGLWEGPAKMDSLKSEIMRSPMDAYTEQGLEIRSEKGVAYWNRTAEDYSQYFVLHPQARVNSIMEITNPMNGRTIHAKVVSKIPDNAYTKDIRLVVSPAVARQLGVLDPRFYVTYQYIQ